MPIAHSRVSTDIDFDREGKQTSVLRVPNSVNDSAYGTIPIPITVIKGGSGPTMFFTGGVHGDEYEGPLALIDLARQLSATDVKGRVIIIPCLNLPAALAGDRLSPIDNLNLNRVFPGDRNGTVSLMIAHYVATVVLPLTDIQIDLHSGGKTLEFICMIQMNESGNAEQDRRAVEAMSAFGAPIGLINQNPDDTGLLETTCSELGIFNLSTELGGAGMVSPRNLSIAAIGIRNLMRYFGVLTGEIETPAAQGRAPTRFMRINDSKSYVMAPDDGLYRPRVDLGDWVKEGDILGEVYYLHHIEKDPWPVLASSSGLLICKRPPGRVLRGDNIGIVAQDI